MVFVFEFKFRFADSNKNHEKYNLTFQNRYVIPQNDFSNILHIVYWPPIQNYFCCPCHGCIFIYLSSNNVQIIFFMSFILVWNSKSEFKPIISFYCIYEIIWRHLIQINVSIYSIKLDFFLFWILCSRFFSISNIMYSNEI